MFARLNNAFTLSDLVKNEYSSIDGVLVDLSVFLFEEKMPKLLTNVGILVIFGLILSVLSHGKVFRFRTTGDGMIRFR